MAIKYTEEQLNTVDKSIIIQMFLNQQEELSKAVNQIEQLTKEVQSGNDKLQRMMEQIILSNNARFGRSSEKMDNTCLLYTSPSPRDLSTSRMPSSA